MDESKLPPPCRSRLFHIKNFSRREILKSTYCHHSLQRRNDLSISPTTTFSSSHNSPPSLSPSIFHLPLRSPFPFLAFWRSTRVARRFACPGNYPLYSLISPTLPSPPSLRARSEPSKCARVPSTLLSHVRASRVLSPPLCPRSPLRIFYSPPTYSFLYYDTIFVSFRFDFWKRRETDISSFLL